MKKFVHIIYHTLLIVDILTKENSFIMQIIPLYIPLPHFTITLRTFVNKRDNSFWAELIKHFFPCFLFSEFHRGPNYRLLTSVLRALKLFNTRYFTVKLSRIFFS